MIDFGLLTSIIGALAVPALLGLRWAPISLDSDTTVIDAFLAPAAMGLVAGRLVTLAIDDPGSIGSVSDMLVIRSGVEFWPGAGAALVTTMWLGRRCAAGALGRLADLTPLAMVGYGTYEAACLFRDGCYGPASAIGLRPDGLDVRMVPIGLVMAAATIASAAAVRGPVLSQRPPLAVVAAGVAFVAIIRSIASIWLPRLGTSMSRQHAMSVVISVLAATTFLVAVRLSRRDHEAAVP